jgi:hypothetical protein
MSKLGENIKNCKKNDMNGNWRKNSKNKNKIKIINMCQLIILKHMK